MIGVQVKEQDRDDLSVLIQGIARFWLYHHRSLNTVIEAFAFRYKINRNMEGKPSSRAGFVSYWVGALSPVRHKGLYQER